MTSYRDHPLSILNARVSPEGLRWRAQTWRNRGHTAPGLDVIEILEEAADEVEARSAAMSAVAKNADSLPSFAPAGGAELADRLWAEGQALRASGADPYGGSTAAAIEMASDEIRLLSAAMDGAIAMRDGGRPSGEIERAAGDALGVHAAETTHEAPPLRM